MVETKNNSWLVLANWHLHSFQKTYGERKMTRTLILIGLLMASLPAQAQTFEFGPGGLRVNP